MPFERLVEVLNPVRSQSRHPLFQVMLAFEAGEAGSGTLELPGLAVVSQPIATASAKFDLSVGLVERRLPDGMPGGIDGVLEYASDLFDDATVERLGLISCGCWRPRLRMPAAARPSAASDRGRARYHPRTWNDTRVRLLPKLTLQALFEAQAVRTPDAVAVVFEDGS